MVNQTLTGGALKRPLSPRKAARDQFAKTAACNTPIGALAAHRSSQSDRVAPVAIPAL
jgi:hypothetical protein